MKLIPGGTERLVEMFSNSNEQSQNLPAQREARGAGRNV